MENIDKIYFCLHTFEFYFRLTECDKKLLTLFIYLEASTV